MSWIQIKLKFILLSNLSHLEEAIKERHRHLKKQLLLVEVNSEAHEFINRKRRKCDGEDKMQG